MTPDPLSRRTVHFVNLAHALDHYVLLIYPTAVIAIAAEVGAGYGALIGLSTGAFVAFGLFSLPMGWLAERFGRRNLMCAFFLGSGLSCLALSMAATPAAFAIGLTVLGVFAAIYHPIGLAMLVSHAGRLGRDLGTNGVWGNMGAALAPGATATLAALFGWQTAFVVPGLICITVGVVFVVMVPDDGNPARDRPGTTTPAPAARPRVMLAVFAAAVVAAGVTFNIVTIALPKVIEDQVTLDLPLILTGSIATTLFIAGALTQLTVGRLVDRIALPRLFVALALLQPLGLGLAAVSLDIGLIAGMTLALAAIYGQVIVNDAMVAHYVPVHLRAKAFSVRYFLGFGTAGLAVPMIAILYETGGTSLVLALAGFFGVVIFISAIAFAWAASAASKPRPAE